MRRTRILLRDYAKYNPTPSAPCQLLLFSADVFVEGGGEGCDEVIYISLILTERNEESYPLFYLSILSLSLSDYIVLVLFLLSTVIGASLSFFSHEYDTVFLSVLSTVGQDGRI